MNAGKSTNDVEFDGVVKFAFGIGDGGDHLLDARHEDGAVGGG